MYHAWQVRTILHDSSVTLNLNRGEFFTNINNNLSHVIGLERLKVWTFIVETIRGLLHHVTVIGLWGFLALCNVFHNFVLKFGHVTAALNKMLRNGQLQTFDGLTEHEITALEVLMAKLVEPAVLASPRSQGNSTTTKMSLTHATSKLDVFLSRNNLHVPKYQLDNCIVRLTTPNARTTSLINSVSVWLWCAPYCCSPFTWNNIDLQSG